VNNATPEQLPVLNEELPAWLAAKNQPSTWVSDAIAKVDHSVGQANEQAATADRKLRKIEHSAKVVANAYKSHNPVDLRLLLDPT
jgi:hypothetical protein